MYIENVNVFYAAEEIIHVNRNYGTGGMIRAWIFHPDTELFLSMGF